MPDLATGDVPELIERCLDELSRRGGSDLILSASTAPRLRVDGLVHTMQAPPLEESEIGPAVDALIGPELAQQLHSEGQVDFSIWWREGARVRGNAFLQRGTTALVLRLLPARIPTMAQLDLPPAVQAWTASAQGFALVTGPTGGGKSTTVAALLDHINQTQARHIITLEDPIEYVHEHKLGVVNQREVGTDTSTFAAGLRSVLREDPDVVLVGEMRDLESIQSALTIAETGHLVIATLHTNDSGQSVDRIVDVFATDRQAQIRLQLANTLLGIAHQILVPRRGGGQVGAFDVLVATRGVRSLIREGKTTQLRNLILTGQREGMQTLEASLNALVSAGVIDRDRALERARYPAEILPTVV